MDEPKFTKESWKRTYTTIPHVVEGYDVSSDIVNVTIGDRNIPLAAWCMNSTAELAEYYHTMEANASLMASAPKLYKKLHDILEQQCGECCGTVDVGDIRGKTPCEKGETCPYGMDDVKALLAEARGEE